jgi:CheY-like chemotaxis protein
MTTPAPAPLLVVDDEDIVCQSCTRILSNEGFRVDTQTNPVEGLKMAASTDYAAILLDLKMREMDGLEFLDQLRRTNADVPVIVITGYPSQDTADASVRLGASNYLAKPFTPEELKDSVRRATKLRTISAKATKAAVVEAEEAKIEVAPWEDSGEHCRFLGEAWFQLGDDASVRAGAVMPRIGEDKVLSLDLPRVGDLVHAGLPLAALDIESQSRKMIASPVTGKVLEVNRGLAESPGDVCVAPCIEAWIARIQPTQLADDLRRCRARSIILGSQNRILRKQQSEHLAQIGCSVYAAETAKDVLENLRAHPNAVLLLDEASFGETGPEVVAKVNFSFPDAKVVVLAESGSKQDLAFRSKKIFYYAVNPFEDGEILDILHNVFGTPDRPDIPDEMESKFLPRWVSRIHITNRKGTKVTLLVLSEVLLYHKGLGRQLIGKILQDAYPIETTRGIDARTSQPAFIQSKLNEEAIHAGRLLILAAEDRKRLPGQYLLDRGHPYVSGLSGEARTKAGVLVVQPGEDREAPLAFDARTSNALADHILKEMVSR